MLKKRGAAHFEMIFSFVFFVGFIFFLVITLKPYDDTTLSTAVSQDIYNSFFEKTSTNLTSIFLNTTVSPTSPSTCFSVTLPNRLFKNKFNSSRVRSVLAADVITASVDVSDPEITLNVKANASAFNVLFSSTFGDVSISGCDILDDGEYFTGNIIENKVISYDLLKDLNASYYSDYDSLKSDFNVPEILDFGIVFDDNGLGFNMERFIPDEGNVVARDYLIEILRNENIINTRVIVKVW
jgi:hypothetical protein